MRKQLLTMLHHYKKVLFALSLIALTVGACKKNISSDAPLPNSYYPSVIIGSDNFVLYGIDPHTGSRNWEFSMPADTFAVASNFKHFKPSPLVYNDMVYQVAVNSDTIYKLNGFTGKLVKKMVLPGHSAVSLPGHFFTCMATPIADGNLIYLATSNDTLYAIDTGTGAIKWKFGNLTNDHSGFVASPVIYNGKIYVASQGLVGSNNAHVYCLDKTTGPDASGFPIWDWPGLGVTSTALFISSPTISYPHLYIGGASDSNMYSINLNPPVVAGVTPTVGLLHWTFKTNGNIMSSPTSYAGMCIFGCNDFNLYCVDTQTGAQRWKFPTGSQINSSPIISNQVVYVGSYDYYLYAVNIISGMQKWRFKTKGLIKSSPLPYNGSVYVGSYDGYLYAVDSAQGTLKWNYKINGYIQSSPAIDDYSGIQYNSAVSGYNTHGTNN